MSLLFTDPRSQQTYPTIEIDGMTWLAQNLYLPQPEGCFEHNGQLFYTWQAALDACPQGWHLPSVDEWKRLLLWAGGYFDWATQEEKGNATDGFNAFVTPETGKMLGFGLLYAGWRNLKGNFYDQDEIAYFWTSSADNNNEEEAHSIDFNKANLCASINYNDLKVNAYSVRYVKD